MANRWPCALGAAILAIVVSAGAACAADAGPGHALPVAAWERGAYRARDARTGEELWSHAWALERTADDEATRVRVQQHGHGRRDHAESTAWVAEMRLSFGPGPRRLTSRRESRSIAGAPVRTEERELDYLVGRGRAVVQEWPGGRRTVREFPLPSEAIDVEMLPVALRMLPRAEGQRRDFDLVTAEGRVLAMQARLEGRERIVVPAGGFDCYRIGVALRGGLGLLADLLLPRLLLWHRVDPPHVWVRSRGAEAIGAPTVVRELVDFEAASE